jgi:hypothetical protein
MQFTHEQWVRVGPLIQLLMKLGVTRYNNVNTVSPLYAMLMNYKPSTHVVLRKI